MRRWWLAPLTPVYRAGVALREWRIEKGHEMVQRLKWPVVSVGNLSTGGAGKTPLTIALARGLKERGVQVDVLSRGYGRRGKGVARASVNGDAAEFGDEPLLIARATGVPVFVAAQRYDAGLLAESSAVLPFGFHLLDDGFQHRQLARDVDIVLLNREDLQDCLLPRGNLREPLTALRRAQVLAIPADDGELETELRAWGFEGCVWRVRRVMETPAVDGPVLAFCGIARAEQFFRGLEDAGLKVEERAAFRDHHPYTAEDLARLLAVARMCGAVAMVTTEKDMARLGKLAAILPESMPLKTAKLRVEIEDAAAAMEWLMGRVAPGIPNAAL